MSSGNPSPRSRTTGALSPERQALLAKLLAKKGIQSQAPTKIPPRAKDGPAPLSFAQEALWFLEQLEPTRATHNQPSAVRLTGPLDADALARALGEIRNRHEPLRSHFETRDGKPFQVIAPPSNFALPRVDLTHLAPEASRTEGLKLATEEAHTGFDLETGPLFRAILIQLEAEQHILTLNSHHIITDGWSMGVFTRELQALYEAFTRGEPSPLEPLPIQLADFAVWQRENLQGKVLDDHLSYWKEQLSGKLTSLEFPTDRPRPDVQSFRGGHHTVQLSAKLSNDLRALARTTGVTPFATLEAAFLITLYHTCRVTDMIIGSAVAHRNREELEGLIAFLVNMLVMRVDLSGNPTFIELQRRVQKVTLGAWSHQDLPLSRILREVAPDRDLSRNPLFQVQFSLLTPDHNPAVYGYGLSSGDIEEIKLGELAMTPIDVHYDNARYDIAAFLWDMPQGIQGTIEYSSDLFEPDTIARLVERFEKVLNSVVASPSATLEDFTRELDQLEEERKAATRKAFKSSMNKGLKSIKRRKSSTPSGTPATKQEESNS